MKEKIFISAFSCMPHMGSEPGVGWHWVLEMSKYFELWVLVHKEQIDDIESFVIQNGLNKTIHFIYYDIPLNSLFFKNGNFKWVRTYYYIWTILSNKIVKKTMQDNGINIFHHLTFGNAIWPVSKFGQTQKFIWGPIGGVETIPEEFTKHYDIKSRILESIRRIMVKSLKYRIGFNQRCKNAYLILCKTEAMRMAVPEKWRQKAVLFTDVAVEDADTNCSISSNNSPNKTIELLSVGRLDAWRGFDLLLEAFAIAYKQNPQMHLTILGNGMYKAELLNMRSRLGIEKTVDFLGNIPMDEYRQKIAQCDFVVNSSLKEGAVTVSFDSMRYGKPLICVDTGGYTRYFNNDYAMVLPQQNRESLIQSLADAIIRLASDIKLRKSMGEKAQRAGKQFLWETKGEQIRDLIYRLDNNIHL